MGRTKPSTKTVQWPYSAPLECVCSQSAKGPASSERKVRLFPRASVPARREAGPVTVTESGSQRRHVRGQGYRQHCSRTQSAVREGTDGQFEVGLRGQRSARGGPSAQHQTRNGRGERLHSEISHWDSVPHELVLAAAHDLGDQDSRHDHRERSGICCTPISFTALQRAQDARRCIRGQGNTECTRTVRDVPLPGNERPVRTPGKPTMPYRTPVSFSG